jgi:hypothetical protein
MTEGKALKAEIEQLVNAQIHNDEVKIFSVFFNNF